MPTYSLHVEGNAIRWTNNTIQNVIYSSSLSISFLTELVIKVSSVTACRSLLQLLK